MKQGRQRQVALLVLGEALKDRMAILSLHFTALKHNAQQLKALAPNAQILPMLKANAYGHGALVIAKALPEVDGFGVATVDEGLALRDAGIKQAIVVMQGAQTHETWQAAIQQDLTLTVHNASQLAVLKTQSSSVKIWVQIDIGMHCLGFLPRELDAVWETVQQCNIDREALCWFGHFPGAYLSDKQQAQQQAATFLAATNNLPGQKSLANSAAILSLPESHLDWQRPGIAVYGISPFEDKTAQDLGLQPVMQFTAPLLSIRELKKGDAISYGSTWTCPEDRRVGIVGVGYGDGYPHQAAPGTPVFFDGQLLPRVGKVAMDMMAIDLSNAPAAKIGDTVELWGANLPVEVIAKQANTIPYVLTTQVTNRVKRAN